MTYCSNDSASNNEDFSTQILGETGGTVVYVFANGNARVKKGKKVTLETDLESRGDRTASANPKNHKNPAKGVARGPAPTDATKPLPPPPLKPNSLKRQGPLQPSVSSKRPDHPLSNPLPSSKPLPAPTNSPLQSTSLTTLIHYLLDKKLISSVQIEVAQYDSNASGLSLEEVLLARGWVTQEVIAEFHQMVR